MTKRHLLIGILFWVGTLVGGWSVLRTELSSQASSVTDLSTQVSHWLTARYQKLAATCERSIPVAIGDPIFLQSDAGSFRQVGQVVRVDDVDSKRPRSVDQFDVQIYNSAIESFPQSYRLEHHRTPMSLDWVVKTMIPPERQQEIALRLRKVWLAHQLELTARIRPIIREGMRRGLEAVESELPRIVKQHRDEFRGLGQKYEAEILTTEFLPLVREEILPIVEEEALPLVEDVGRALWKRVSLWSFTWRFLYDKSPLPKKDAFKAEFQRFVDQEAIPELKSHTDEFVDMTETIVRRTLENPEVKHAAMKNLKRVARDPELHQVLWNVVREAIVENQTLRLELEAYMKERETQAAMDLIGGRLEPTIREIGDLIFGTPKTGITPEFSRILRSQILTKDRRWFVMTPDFADESSSSQIRVVPADSPMIFPLGFSGENQSPLTPMK